MNGIDLLADTSKKFLLYTLEKLSYVLLNGSFVFRVILSLNVVIADTTHKPRLDRNMRLNSARKPVGKNLKGGKMIAELKEYVPKFGANWRGDFYLSLEAETMEEAGLLCRLSLNNLKGETKIGHTSANTDGTFTMSICIPMKKDWTQKI